MCHPSTTISTLETYRQWKINYKTHRVGKNTSYNCYWEGRQWEQPTINELQLLDTMVQAGSQGTEKVTPYRANKHPAYLGLRAGSRFWIYNGWLPYHKFVYFSWSSKPATPMCTKYISTLLFHKVHPQSTPTRKQCKWTNSTLHIHPKMQMALFFLHKKIHSWNTRYFNQGNTD